MPIQFNSSLSSSGAFTAPSYTGSLFGTASYALFIDTASNAVSASYVPLVAGPGVFIDGMKISASVLTVNGSFPDANGNIATALTEAITGLSSSLVVSSSGDATGSLTEGTVWVISGEVAPSASLNGVSYIYDIQNGAGEWLKLSSLDQVAADNRYLMLTPQAPLAGPLSAPQGVTGSLLGTASYASVAVSASLAQSASVSFFSVTASHAISAISSSYALSASYVQLPSGSQVLFNTTGSWTVPVGSSVQSFTVAAGATYTMWLYANIPNGIITWNATATISNTNVPACGVQYCWVYTGGGTVLDITSIPDQIVGTSGSILRSVGTVSGPSNVFSFGFSNASGTSQTVYYGYTKQ